MTEPGIQFVPMQPTDLDWVAEQDQALYPFPWSAGNFADSMAVGYSCWIMRDGGERVGYAVLMPVLDEAHILNICIAPEAQGHGHGRRLLRALIRLSRQQRAARIFLEVRPSNPKAIALYHDEGFNEIGRRPRYYPAHMGREDAIVMAMELLEG